MLPNAPKISNTKGHVGVVKNISNVVANKLANHDEIRKNASFFFAEKLRVYML